MDERAKPKTLLVIPALNEAASIAQVVRNARQRLPDADLLVINDGSGDDTAAVARAAGAMVVTLPFNMGIGAAVQTGFVFAGRNGYEIMLRSDGDGQHTRERPVAPARGPWLRAIAISLPARASVPIAAPGLFPRARRLGILLLARLISLITGQSITDPTSGMAAFNRAAIRLFAQEYPHDYPEPEGIVLAHRAGLRLRELPVTMLPRRIGRSSISHLDGVYYMLKVTLAILISLLRPARPR